MYTYIYIYIHIHTYIHACICTFIPFSNVPLQSFRMLAVLMAGARASGPNFETSPLFRFQPKISGLSRPLATQNSTV